MKDHIVFESYCYDRKAAEDYSSDPYSISSTVECDTLEEAAEYAADNIKDFCKYDYTDYGGAVVMLNGVCIFDVLRNGEYVFGDCAEFKKLFRSKMN